MYIVYLFRSRCFLAPAAPGAWPMAQGGLGLRAGRGAWKRRQYKAQEARRKKKGEGGRDLGTGIGIGRSRVGTAERRTAWEVGSGKWEVGSRPSPPITSGQSGNWKGLRSRLIALPLRTGQLPPPTSRPRLLRVVVAWRAASSASGGCACW
jgi:hypothetical protein